jgi:hypothetical protein
MIIAVFAPACNNFDEKEIRHHDSNRRKHELLNPQVKTIWMFGENTFLSFFFLYSTEN